MSIAILGKSQINSLLKMQLSEEGIISYDFEDLSTIESVKGEKGAFKIKAAEGSFAVSDIIVTEEPSCRHDSISNHECAILLEDEVDLDDLPNKDTPVVFILDYPVDSPTHMTRTALEKAIRLARRKRKVLYLARFMRTAGGTLESLYREARNLGVTFFKYESITVDYQDTHEMFLISVSDKSDSLEVLTATAVFTGRVVYSDAFEKIIRLLKLKMEKSAGASTDRFFLFPSLTNRKGIYFLNMSSTSGYAGEALLLAGYILMDIKSSIQSDLYPAEYLKVDAEKCAFCYTCYRACPHSAMTPDYENSVMKNLRASCCGCGICSSLCPANAISMVSKKDKEENAVMGSLKIFCCENSGEPAFRKIADGLIENGVKVELTPVACGGELSPEVMASALEDFDKVLVAVCMDNACRHFEGNKRAKRYVERVKEMLRSSGMDENRIVYLQLSHAMPKVLDGYIRELV